MGSGSTAAMEDTEEMDVGVVPLEDVVSERDGNYWITY